MRLASICLFAFSLVLGGCTAGRPLTGDIGGSVAPVALEQRSNAERSGEGAATQPTPRQLIRRGRMEVTVDQVRNARTRLEQAAAALGAQVARLEAHEERRAQYLFRVPPQQLDALMDSAAALGAVDVRAVMVDDVTEQVVDLEARLVALRASRGRLLQLMQQSASVSEVIMVERELARVQAELDSLEARLTFFQGRVALSELTVHLEQRIVLGPLGIVAAGIAKFIEKLFILR